MELEIYTLVGCPVIGELGKATYVQHSPVCEICNRRWPSEFSSIEYCFNFWGGEDLVTSTGCYVVSDRLRQAIEETGLTGLIFEEMKVSKENHFEIVDAAYQDTLPNFHRLVVTGVAEGPEIWWTSSICKTCSLKCWDITPIGIEAKTGYTRGVVGIPREVYLDSWNGEDIFNLQDFGPPIVTQRFADVIGRFTQINKDTWTSVHLHPAKWVE